MAITCIGKTEVMFNRHIILSLVIVDRKAIEEVDSNVYLGKKIVRDGALHPKKGCA